MKKDFDFYLINGDVIKRDHVKESDFKKCSHYFRVKLQISQSVKDLIYMFNKI